MVSGTFLKCTEHRADLKQMWAHSWHSFPFNMIGQNVSTKKYCRGIEQAREAQSSRKKKDKAVSFLKNEKILEQSAVE